MYYESITFFVSCLRLTVTEKVGPAWCSLILQLKVQYLLSSYLILHIHIFYVQVYENLFT